jgi:hypothetical protein
VSTRDELARWRTTGAITAEQHDAIWALVRPDRLSVFVELNALLYLGVLAIAGGAGWTIRVHFARLGDAAILLPLTALLTACLAYCFRRGAAYSRDQVAPPGLAFDYVLYLGCLLFAVELWYVEFRFQLLQANWDGYVLASAVAYFVLAYRFDNRLVLSLALGTLASWFGIRSSQLGMFADSLRVPALAYGVLVFVCSLSVHRLGIKRHFLETYLHIAANVLLLALLSGVILENRHELPWLFGLLVLAGAAIGAGVTCRRFAFVLYGVIYGYLGISAHLLERIIPNWSDASILAYFAISATLVVVSLVVASRRVGREE